MFNLQITPRDNNPFETNESIGVIELHKSFLMEMRERKPSIMNVLSNNGKFPTHLNPADIIQDKGFIESARYLTANEFQYVNKEDLNRLIVTVSGTSIRMIQRIVNALSLDIATLFDGFSYDIVKADYMDKNWVVGHVFAEYDLEENRRYFRNLTIGGFIVDNDVRGKDQSLLHMVNYSGKTGDVFQSKKDELDKNVPYCRQIVKGNHLFSFRGISDKLRGGRKLKDLQKLDFNNVNHLFNKVKNLKTVEERFITFGENPHANVNTFIIDIAIPYISDDKVKVKHITFAYFDDYQQLFLMNNVNGSQLNTFYFDGQYTTATELPDYYKEYPEKLKYLVS